MRPPDVNLGGRKKYDTGPESSKQCRTYCIELKPCITDFSRVNRKAYRTVGADKPNVTKR